MIRERYAFEIRRAQTEWNGKPAQWGKDDCAMAISNIDRAAINLDPAKVCGYRGRYRSAAGAQRVMGKRGVLGMATKIAKRMGWQTVAPGLAQDGDRGVAHGPGGLTCVIRLAGFWVGRFDRGDILATDRQMVAAWAVC